MSNGQIPAEQVAGLATAIAAAVSTALADLTASEIDFAPTGDLDSTDVQAAVVEVYAAIATQIAALVDSSPSTLDTLNELAAALGDDPNFAATVTTALGTKLDAEQVRDLVGTLLVAGSNVTITVDDPGNTVTISATDTNTTDPEVVRDTIATALVAGTNVTVTPDDAGDTITIAATDTTDPEVVRDTMAAALVAGANVTITPDDAYNTITIAATGGGGGGPATTRWEVVVAGNPAEAVTTVDGSDWLYVEVPI